MRILEIEQIKNQIEFIENAIECALQHEDWFEVRINEKNLRSLLIKLFNLQNTKIK